MIRNKPNRILVFGRDSAVPPISGAGGVSTWGISNGFSKLGCNVLVLSKMYFKRIKPFEKKRNIRIIRCLKYPYFLTKYIWSIELFLSYLLFRPTIVLIRVPDKKFISDLKYLDMVINLITVPVLSKIVFVPEKWSKNLDQVLNHSDYIIYERDGQKKLLDDANQKKSILLPNGIDLNLFNYEKTRSNKQNKNYIVLLGSVDKYRNTIRFVKIFSKSKINKNIKLKIIGDGPDSRALRELIVDLGIENRVDLLGRVQHEKVPFLIKDSLLGVVLPNKDSISYTHPLKLFEFLSMGVPVLTIKELEIINELNPNCLITVDNYLTKNIKKAIEHICFDENTAKLCIIEANKYSWKNCVKKLLLRIKNESNPSLIV